MPGNSAEIPQASALTMLMNYRRGMLRQGIKPTFITYRMLDFMGIPLEDLVEHVKPGPGKRIEDMRLYVLGMEIVPEIPGLTLERP